MEDDLPWWRDSISLKTFQERRNAAAETAVKGDEARDARQELYHAKLEELGGPKRNWAIWRRYKAGGVTLKQVGDEFGVSPERVRQITIKCDRKVRGALNRNWDNVSDEIRDATLGVEFVFRNEVTFEGWNGDMRGWDKLELEEHGSAYSPPNPEWRTEWGEQDTKPTKPPKAYTCYKIIIQEEQVMENKVTPETFINELEASLRLANCFKNEYDYLKELNSFEDRNAKVKHFLGIPDNQLLRMPNFGRKTLNEWREMTAHLKDGGTPYDEECLAEVKLLREITSQIRMIAANHKATGTLYSKLADFIANIR